ncbi:MAG: DUF3368 domain-containing protein [Leptospiraceae bacterium]|nr:DUF3368 domain-containing protein [Leptospiraceae bacterium]MCP5502800.1 DUF3368 domain-containing protein [Leptospiraceae bacterium]
MIVVSDTSPISGLLIIEKEILLEELYHQVFIPVAVKNELLKIKERRKRLTAFLNSKAIIIKDNPNSAFYKKLRKELDEGESQAIALAQELKSGLILIDETKGRMAAKNSGLNVIGLMGILLEAKTKSLVTTIKPELDILINNNFWVHESLYDKVLILAGEK